MANIDATDLLTRPIPAGEYGNSSQVTYAITLAANAAIGDVIRLGRNQQGLVPHDAQLFISAGVAGATLSAGYVTDSGSNQDPAYFLSAQSVASAGRFRANTNKPPVELAEPGSWALTVGGAAIPAGTTITLIVSYNVRGTL